MGIYRTALGAFSHFVEPGEFLSLVPFAGNGYLRIRVRKFKTAVAALEAFGKFCFALTAKMRFLTHVFDSHDLSFIAVRTYQYAERAFRKGRFAAAGDKPDKTENDQENGRSDKDDSLAFFFVIAAFFYKCNEVRHGQNSNN